MGKTVARNDLNLHQRRSLKQVMDHVTMNGHYEVKSISLKECYGDVSVVIETGMANDEGTMAYYFCRDTYIFWVGKKGGVYQYKEKKKGGYRRVYRKYGIVEC